MTVPVAKKIKLEMVVSAPEHIITLSTYDLGEKALVSLSDATGARFDFDLDDWPTLRTALDGIDTTIRYLKRDGRGQ